MYKELKGICKEAIAQGKCLGCNKLLLESFEGVTECKYLHKDIKTDYKANTEQIKLY